MAKKGYVKGKVAEIVKEHKEQIKQGNKIKPEKQKEVELAPDKKTAMKPDKVIPAVKQQAEEEKHNIIKWAWAYYNKGFNLIPIGYKTKRPHKKISTGEIKKWQYKRQPKELIQEWIDKGLFEGIAILGGKVSENTVCFDFDNPQDFVMLGLTVDQLLKDGAWVTETPQEPGRYHIVIRDKNEVTITRKEKHIDYRANEHYWLVYPSVHPNGKQYNFLNTHDPDKLELPTQKNTLAMFETWNNVLNEKKGTDKKISDTKDTKTKFDKSPDCVRNAWQMGAEPGSRYYVATGLGSWLQQQKFPLEMAKDIVKEWFKTKCDTTGRPIKDIENAVAVGYEGKYKTGCSFWRDKTLFCPYPDKKDCKFYNPKAESIIKIKGDIEETEIAEEESKEEPQPKYHNGFIGTIEQYYNERTNAPRAYATHLGLQILGFSVGYNTVHMIQPLPVHHNTYLLLLGPSTLSRKTTAQDLAIDLIPELNFLLPSGFSPQGLLKALSGLPYGYLPMGEFSSVLRGIRRAGNMADLKEILNELHRCPERYEKKLVKMSDSFVIYEPYLNVSTTCTAEEFFPNLTEEVVHGGFCPRFMIVPGNSRYRPRSKLPKNTLELRKQIRKCLDKVYDLFVQPKADYAQKNKITFELTPDGLKEFNRIDEMLTKDPQWRNVKPFVGRYLDYIIVYADLLFLSDIIGTIGINQFNNLTNLTHLTNLTSLTITNLDKRVNKVKLVKLVKLIKIDVQQQKKNCLFLVDKSYVLQAWNIIKPCLEYTKQIVQYLDEDVKVGRLSAVLDKHAPLPRSTAMQYSHLIKKDFDDAVETLQERETVFELNILSERSDVRGNPIKRVYCTRKNIGNSICKKCPFKCKLENRIPELEGFTR